MLIKYQNSISILSILLLIIFLTSSISAAQEGIKSSEIPRTVGSITVQEDASIYHNPVLGVNFTYPSHLQILEDQYLSSSYGVTLVNKANPDSLILRISFLHEVPSEDLQKQITNILNAFPDIPIRESTASIDGIPATKLSSVPGIVESTYFFVSVNNRIYEIIYDNSQIGSQENSLLDNIRFESPSHSLESLSLKRADDVLFAEPPTEKEPIEESEDEHNSHSHSSISTESPDQQLIDLKSQLFRQISATASGCVNFPTWKYLQTQWGSTANNGTGKSWAGSYYFGQGTHVDCNSSGGLNDYYDLDHSLVTWNTIYPPASGTVIYSGWAGSSWCSLGRIVVIDIGSGYKVLAAHLRGVTVSTGTYVTTNTLIGYAGGSGCYSDGAFSTHLHQGRYLNATLSTNPAGLYGGQSAQPIKVYHSGGYYWYINNGQEMKHRP